MSFPPDDPTFVRSDVKTPKLGKGSASLFDALFFLRGLLFLQMQSFSAAFNRL